MALTAAALPAGASSEKLEAATRAAVAHSERFNGRNYAQAQLGLRLTTEQLGTFFADHDLLLSPTLAHPSRPIGFHDANENDWPTFFARMLDDIPFTPLFNASGGPAMSLPLGRSADGFPNGVQVGAPLGKEELLLGLAHQVEQAQPWHTRE